MFTITENRFIRLNFITIVVTLLLILAGGIVRSTGSGMGCPDWPKCFDQYIPPTKITQLPINYKEKYVAQRKAKNERFAKTLDKLGKQDLASLIRNDSNINTPEDFNATKTWIEYINRLLGAITGFLLLGVAFLSFYYNKIAKRILVLSVINLIVVAFQAWLGSIVVSTNLLQWIVTLHMLLALVILAILIYTYYYAKQLKQPNTVVIAKPLGLKILVVFSIVLSVLQIILGTEVRETIDIIAKNLNYNERNTWISKIGDTFLYHRDMALAVLIINVFTYLKIKEKFAQSVKTLLVGNLVVLILMVQITTGLLLSYLALPPYAQALHILFATLLFSFQYYLYLITNNSKKLAIKNY